MAEAPALTLAPENHLGALFNNADFHPAPGSPVAYPEELDAVVLVSLEKKLAQNAPQSLLDYLSNLLKNYPVGRLLGLLEQDSDLCNALSRVLVPLIYKATDTYAKETIPYAIAHPMAGMNLGTALRFALMAVKDPATAEHCIDTRGVSESIGWALKQTVPAFSKYEQWKPDVDSATITHDLGKSQMAAVFLLAPFNRDRHLPEIFRANMVDPLRKRPIQGLEGTLTKEELENFQDVICAQDGQGPIDVQKVEALIVLLKSKRFAFHNIPLRYLMNVMRDTKEDGQLPSYVEGLQGQSIEEKFLPLLREHQEALQHLNAIFSLYEMDGYDTTFADVIQNHEGDTVDLLAGQVSDCVSRLAGNHHGYPSTTRRFGQDWKQLNGLFRPAQVVASSDVISALSQVGRTYVDSSGRRPEQVAGIFGAEVIGKGLATEDVVRALTPLILEGNAAPGRVLWTLHENIMKAFGTPTWKA